MNEWLPHLIDIREIAGDVLFHQFRTFTSSYEYRWSAETKTPVEVVEGGLASYPRGTGATPEDAIGDLWLKLTAGVVRVYRVASADFYTVQWKNGRWWEYPERPTSVKGVSS